MAKTCEICSSIGALVKKPRDGVTVVQRKKNLGLLTASYVGHRECIEVLTAAGANVNGTDEMFHMSSRRKLCKKMGFDKEVIYLKVPHERLGCFTPLICAAVNGHLKCIDILVKKGADVNLVSDRRTALGTAAEYGNFKCLKCLIDLGANVNVADSIIRPALMCATLGQDKDPLHQKKCIEILMKAGADVNAGYHFTDEKLTPLADVVKHGTLEILSILIEAGADLNMGSGRYFPLHVAALHGRFKAAKVLTAAGANVNKRDDFGETPLHASLTFFSQGCFNLMIKLGADVNIASDKGVTPLMRAARSCRNL